MTNTLKFKTLKIGTRGSPLALKQTQHVIAALKEHWPDLECEIRVIRTSGDWTAGDGEIPIPEDSGGKSQFAKEIEQALLAGAIDCGVHSVKDMAATLPDGLIMNHFLPRGDVRDAILCSNCTSLSDIKNGARVGTCAPRRKAVLLHKRPDLKIEPMRGNVHTRIKKLCEGQVDVTILAMAGLVRLGLDQGAEHGKVVPLSPEEMLPACGQGAIGIEIHQEREDVNALLKPINDRATAICIAAEREIVRVLDGSCHTPMAAYAVLEGDDMHVRAFIASVDGSVMIEESWRGPVSDLNEAVQQAAKLALKIKARMSDDLKRDLGVAA